MVGQCNRIQLREKIIRIYTRKPSRTERVSFFLYVLEHLCISNKREQRLLRALLSKVKTLLEVRMKVLRIVFVGKIVTFVYLALVLKLQR